MYRLYVDEVGTDDLTHLVRDRHRYLSLTGVAMQINHARDVLEPNLNWIKANVFDHDPDDPLILHRKEILGFKGVYQRLRNEATHDLFNRAILRIFRNTEYRVITALIDKQWMVRQEHWERRHPYHYLMEILVEKYAQFLERHRDIGDIMPESRQSKDQLLQNAYTRVIEQGCDFVNAERISAVIRAKKLKFRKKKDNIAGLQLCDLIAHPSHIFVRGRMNHEVDLGPFAIQVAEILWQDRYDRSPYNGQVVGYGIKHLPQ